MIKIVTTSCQKPKFNKLRYIANEPLKKWPLLKAGENYVISEPEYVGSIQQRQDIEVSPPNDRPHHITGIF